LITRITFGDEYRSLSSSLCSLLHSRICIYLLSEQNSHSSIDYRNCKDV
jgi:hypothetical protein